MSRAVAIWTAERSYTASSTQVVSASTRCDTQAPLPMNSSAARTWFASSRTTRRTKTLVSTARMPLADVLSNPLFHIRRSLFCRSLREERLVYVIRRVPPCSANYDLVILLLPFEDGAGSHAEFLANLDRYGDLALSG